MSSNRYLARTVDSTKWNALCQKARGRRNGQDWATMCRVCRMQTLAVRWNVTESHLSSLFRRTLRASLRNTLHIRSVSLHGWLGGLPLIPCRSGSQSCEHEHAEPGLCASTHVLEQPPSCSRNECRWTYTLPCASADVSSDPQLPSTSLHQASSSTHRFANSSTTFSSKSMTDNVTRPRRDRIPVEERRIDNTAGASTQRASRLLR